MGYDHSSSREMYAGRESVHFDPWRGAAASAREIVEKAARRGGAEGPEREDPLETGAKAGRHMSNVRYLEGMRRWLSTVKFRGLV